MLKKLVNVSRAPKNLSPLCAVYSHNGDLTSMGLGFDINKR